MKQAEKVLAVVALFLQLLAAAVGYGRLQANVVSIQEQQIRLENKMDQVLLRQARSRP